MARRTDDGQIALSLQELLEFAKLTEICQWCGAKTNPKRDECANCGGKRMTWNEFGERCLSRGEAKGGAL